MHRETLAQTRDESGNRAKQVFAALGFGIVDAKRSVRYGWVAVHLLVAWPWETASAQDTSWLNCTDSGTCELLAEHDADQETYPFLFSGYIVDPSFPRWSEYAQAIREFPDVRSCLVESERDADQANVLLIDWERVGTGAAADVCIFRIGRSLGDVRELTHWFEFHDFNVTEWSEWSLRPTHENAPLTRLSAIWSIDQWRRVEPSLFYSLTGFSLVYHYRVNVGLNQYGEIVSVSISTPTN